MIKIEITGINELSQRFRAFPDRYRRAWWTTLQQSLLKIWDIVIELGYPTARFFRNVTSRSRLYYEGAHRGFGAGRYLVESYRRTGTLGRSLGFSQTGGKAGRPDIYEVQVGSGHYQAEFGTRLKYAQYVIGENQAWMHKGRWWTLPGTVARKAVKEIEKLIKIMVDEMARWLDGKGL